MARDPLAFYPMNARTLCVLLVLALLGLGAGWWQTGRRAADDRMRATGQMTTLSNELVTVTLKLAEQRKVNASLESDLVGLAEAFGVLSNRWVTVTGDLQRTESEAKAAAESARLEIERRDQQIAGLEDERDDLTQRMDLLNGEISGLNTRITETERKLAASEGDRDQLQRELKRLLAERAELERRFNDLAVLRDQVRKLKEEISIARRVDYFRRGLYGTGKKGAQVLNEGFRNVAKAAPTPTPPLIEAEVGTDGSVRVGTSGDR
jgi:predicted  nucleic acid-binding Zn-ribbon protein